MMMEEKNRWESAREVGLRQLWKAIARRAWLIVAGALLCGLLALSVIPPQYTASVTFYTDSSDTADTYTVLLDTAQTLEKVIKQGQLELTVAQLRKRINAHCLTSNRMFRVDAVSDDPREAKKVAEAIAEILPGQLEGLTQTAQAVAVDVELEGEKQVQTACAVNGLVAFLAALGLGAAGAALWEVYRDMIRGPQDIKRLCDVPVLAVVEAGSEEGDGYIRLRTQLNHLLLRGKGRVIALCGVTQGRERSAGVQLAFSLSRQQRRVILLECDMRRFREEYRGSGLSEFLSGKTDGRKLIRLCGIEHHEKAFHAIVAGRNPANPAELLDSRRMEKMLAKLRKHYDDVILTLPPMDLAADALVVAGKVDMMVLAVEENRCSSEALCRAVEQLQGALTPILGIAYFTQERKGKPAAMKKEAPAAQPVK